MASNLNIDNGNESHKSVSLRVDKKVQDLNVSKVLLGSLGRS